MDGSGFITYDELLNTIRQTLFKGSRIIPERAIKALWCSLDVDLVREADSNPRPFALLEPGSLCPLSLQSAEGRTFESHSGRALELRVSWIMAAC